MVSVKEFYTDRTILVTGGTGFMGKVLLEKMLRSLPGVKTIYVLIRSKKGLTPDDRLKAMTSKMPFTHENVVPNTIQKLVSINGDVTLENLGLSEEDRQKLIKEVSVVFHLSASVRMNLSLKDAVLQNVIGTQNVLKFSADLEHLESIAHLSTAYCNVDVDCMEEKVYETTVDPYNIIDLVRWMKDDDLKKIEDSLISPHPNTYTFTKRLSEIIVKDWGSTLPISIGRPSIVIPAIIDPIPGWIDSVMGPTGVFIASGKGVLKSMLGDRNLVPELIPVDLAINGLILIACLRAEKKFAEVPVYNLTIANYNMNWDDISEKYRVLSMQYPYKKKLWYATGRLTKNAFVHYVLVFFWHVFVAYALDTLLFLFLQEPFLVNVQDRLNQGLSIFKYFVLRPFVFIHTKSKQLETAFEPDEVAEFPVIVETMDVDDYLLNSYIASRKYCVKDDEIVESELYMRRIEVWFLYFLDRFSKLLIIYGAVYFILYVFGKTNWLSYSWYENKFMNM